MNLVVWEPARDYSGRTAYRRGPSFTGRASDGLNVLAISSQGTSNTGHGDFVPV
jgi:hypothetical protein